VIHCSISGYDSDTSEANTPGYDLLAQSSWGLMAITGEPDGDPMKVGIALADVLTAHHAAGAICAALYAREKGGKGVPIEVSLFSAAVSSLVNVAQNALITAGEPARWGNAHASIVPYQLFHGSDRGDLASDARFATNASRVEHRDVLVELLDTAFRSALKSEPDRALVVSVDHAEAGRYDAVGNPILFSGRRFPIRSAPPLLGEHTAGVLCELGITS